MMRWLRIVAVIAVLLLLLVGAVLGLIQAALVSPLPRAIVEDELGELLGRRVRMDSIDVDWGTSSALRDLRVLSYDHRHVALYVPEATAEHATLLRMMLGNHAITSFTAQEVEIGRHVTWLKLDTVEAHRTDGGDTLVMNVTGQAEGTVTIRDINSDDTSRIEIDLRAPADAPDAPFTSLALEAQLVANKVLSLSVRTERLDLGPLVLAVSPSVGQVYGRLTGDITLTLPNGEMTRATGVGNASISESDFVDIPLFASLYDLLRLKSSATERTGSGRMSFRFVDGVLMIDEMDYTNRGAYIEIAGRITDPFKGGDAAIDAYAVASLKPLPDQSVLKVVNNLLGLLQSQVSTIHVTGTIAEQKLQPEPLKNIGDRIGSLLNLTPTDPETPR